MKRLLAITFVAALAISVIPGVAQPKTGKANTVTKISGMVKGDAKDHKFVLGAKGGPFNVDAKGARCVRDGKFYSVNSLKGGDAVVVSGTLTGKNFKATEVKVTRVRGVKPGTPSKKPVGSNSGG
ncbi:MAG TPA: hypothetical protein PLH94_07245 [Fimbriimonadaceae bacterium]|nr:hypothetical protein [Fimbriimonadaceae bacterium]